jgi:hypothetical protein
MPRGTPVQVQAIEVETIMVRIHHLFARACLLGVALLVLTLSVPALTPVVAQEATAMPPTAQVLTLTYESAPTAPPTVENGIFSISSTGPLSGDLTGTYTQDITQLCDCDHPALLTPIDAIFTIVTSDGMLKGYIIGSYDQHSADSDHADYIGHGSILSVSGTYADYYLGDVILDAQVKIVNGEGQSDGGILTITPRL